MAEVNNSGDNNYKGQRIATNNPFTVKPNRANQASGAFLLVLLVGIYFLYGYAG
jgi:hypothetical protein